MSKMSDMAFVFSNLNEDIFSKSRRASFSGYSPARTESMSSFLYSVSVN